MSASPQSSNPSAVEADSVMQGSLPNSSNQSKHWFQTLLQKCSSWIAQHSVLTLFLLLTPFLLLQTWHIQYSCFPLVNWGDGRCPIERVTINPNSLSPLKPGSVHTLKATVDVKAEFRDAKSVNRNVKWTSSNDKIATVDPQGTVHALAPGTVQISATSEKDTSKRDKISTVVEGITRIVLQPSSIAIAIEEKRTLNAELQGVGKFNTAVTWSSSDPQVARVDQKGSVQGIGKGTATIQAKSKQDPTKTATVKVTVSPRVTIDRITITPENLEDLYVGSVESLVAKVEGLGANSEDVSWSSSNSKVIELLNQGRQTQLLAKSSGEVTITAISNQDKSKKATLHLVVLPPVITEISLRPSSLELDLDQKAQICATVNGKGAVNRDVSWSSSNPQVAIVDAKGVITALGKGETKITATSIQDSQQTATATLKTPKSFNWLSIGAGAVIALGATAVGVPLPMAIALGAAAASGVGLWNGSGLPTCR